MGPSLSKLARNKRLMAYTGALMYGGAAFDGALEGMIPGDPSFAIAPIVLAPSIVRCWSCSGRCCRARRC